MRKILVLLPALFSSSCINHFVVSMGDKEFAVPRNINPDPAIRVFWVDLDDEEEFPRPKKSEYEVIAYVDGTMYPVFNYQQGQATSEWWFRRAAASVDADTVFAGPVGIAPLFLFGVYDAALVKMKTPQESNALQR